ncbi:uncharacterized protein PGTG_10892 [Puccinia graminis f. sp. tritici CRL 75-36-700-3]|uniref:Uncharacterized protein n=1 Tax=Puccinia graminis f. sp. tritici (strain CRL 75-36-700-3 / race SCCL) TaxID=418459 RepID=E3KKA8_PUCGT|nr:uncharacterized protein PGTG_10892 [Puccinia graminis f. sp. tritici CRL 75-36-700-3]EFP84733.2 hypothetical protein PGTG_10892 [Puccinia graminis f. sp. tritici CRL 75-36-700-3]
MLDLIGDPSGNDHGQWSQEGFDRLISRCELLAIIHLEAALPPEAFAAYFAAHSIDQVNTKEDFLNRLHLDHLPFLNTRINTLSQSLIPSGLWKEPNKKLRLVLQIQSEIEHVLDQIECVMNTVCPGPGSAQMPTNDQHFRSLKYSRIYRLRILLHVGVMHNILQVFYRARDLFQQIELAPEEQKPQFDACPSRQDLCVQVDCASERIESTIQMLEHPEFDLIQDNWGYDLCGMEKTMEEILTLINPPANLSEEAQQKVRKFNHKPVIQLARVFIPIIKLSKLFFAKLSKRGMNQRRFLTFSEMCSDQIETLAKSTTYVAQDIEPLLGLLFKADLAHRASTNQEFTQITNDLKSHLESALLLVILYYLPLVPDTEGFPVQNYYKTWFVTWNTQFNISIRNFQHAARSFHQLRV